MAIKLLCFALIAMAVVAPVAVALTCGQVSVGLAPCVNYLRGGVEAVPQACCSGIGSLISAAETQVDRQTACKCLKSAAATISGINGDLAAGLPGQCGVSFPYKISPSTDCDSVK